MALKSGFNLYRKLLAVLGLTLALTVNAKGRPTKNPLCYKMLQEISRGILPVRVEQDFAYFQNLRRKMEELPQQLLFSPARLDSAVPPVLRNPVDSGDKGASNFGILEVRDLNGDRKIVKLSYANSAFGLERKPDGTEIPFDGNDLNHSIFREYVLIHKTLGDLGYALKLEGIIPGKILYPWLKGVDQLNGTHFNPTSKPDAVGLVLEDIPGAWNITRREAVPPYLKLLEQADAERVLERIVEIEAVLNGLQIDGSDLQIFLSPDGRILLGDLDDFKLAKRTDKPNTLDFVARDFIHDWESMTGKNFPKERYLAIMARKKRDAKAIAEKASQRREEERLQHWYRNGGEPPIEYFNRYPLPPEPEAADDVSPQR